MLNVDAGCGDPHDETPIVVLGFDAPPSIPGRYVRRADDTARRMNSNVELRAPATH